MNMSESARIIIGLRAKGWSDTDITNYILRTVNESEPCLYANLLEAQADRANGFRGRNARDVLTDIDKIIGDAERI